MSTVDGAEAQWHFPWLARYQGLGEVCVDGANVVGMHHSLPAESGKFLLVHFCVLLKAVADEAHTSVQVGAPNHVGNQLRNLPETFLACLQLPVCPGETFLCKLPLSDISRHPTDRVAVAIEAYK